MKGWVTPLARPTAMRGDTGCRLIDAARAVVSDDGAAIWLTSYTADGAAVPAELSPLRALALADELLRAAIPKGLIQKYS